MKTNGSHEFEKRTPSLKKEGVGKSFYEVVRTAGSRPWPLQAGLACETSQRDRTYWVRPAAGHRSCRTSSSLRCTAGALISSRSSLRRSLRVASPTYLLFDSPIPP